MIHVTLRAWDSPRWVWAAVAALCIAALAAALVGQHVWGHEPCPWCILQRVVMIDIALWALLGALWLHREPAWLVGVPVALSSLAGGAAAIWQQMVASQSASCNLTWADKILYASGLDGMWPDVFAPRASCADAHYAVLGVPYAMWSLLIFAVILAVSVRQLRRH